MNQSSSARKTKAEIAAERLEVAIVNCDLEPGAVVAEADLMEMLDLGRTPVREALVRLSSENLVRLGRAGVVIPELNARTVRISSNLQRFSSSSSHCQVTTGPDSWIC